MTLKTTPFDAAIHFATKEAKARLLNDALASGDGGYIAQALGTIARTRGMFQLAEETGVNRATPYASFSQNGNPSLDTFLKVTWALGFELRAS